MNSGLKKTPVLLLTGYLGSGKTTLLNRILANRRGIRFAVIVNDLGQVNIDADLIQKGGVVSQQDDSLVALQNGCICCTLKMDLVQQLHDIIAQKTFDYIVIEASGICEPAPIAQTICSIPSMGEAYSSDGIPVLDSIVTIVDALRMKDEFGSGSALLNSRLDEDDLENLVIQQIEFCNIILLNKAAEVEPQELERIRQIVRALQPRAEIIDCNYGDVDLDRLLHTGLFDFNRVATSAAWIEEIENHHEDDEDEEEDDDDDEHDEHHHEHHSPDETLALLTYMLGHNQHHADELHELAHGYTAWRLGDDTARNAGRLTLNPLRHIDPMGLLMMVVFHFGWAKPVPVNMYNFKNPRTGMAVTAAAREKSDARSELRASSSCPRAPATPAFVSSSR